MNKTKTLKREQCLIDHKSKIKNFYKFKNFPLFIGCTDTSIKKDKFVNMEWGVSNYGLVQLKKLIDPKELYKKYHSEAIGKVWDRHNIEFCKFIKKYSGSKILEVGSGSCQIAKELVKSKKIKNWINIEPGISKNKIKNKKIKLISNFIENVNSKNYKYQDTFVHSHTLEHFYDPINVLKKVINESNINKMIFSVPNLAEYVKRKYSNSLNFEHTFLLSEELTSFFLKEFNFVVKKKKYFLNHSIFYYAEKSSKIIKKKKPNLKKHKINFSKMVNYYKKEIKKINKIITNSNSPSFIFGAHVFTQFLINFGLKEKLLKNVLDNSDQKYNKRLYGTNLIVKKPNLLKTISQANVIVKVGEYQTEVERQLKQLNNKIRIIR